MTEPEGTQCGTAWGFTTDEEATAYPMTREEYGRWHHPGQACAMLAFKLMENLVRLEIPAWNLNPDERRAFYKVNTWVT